MLGLSPAPIIRTGGGFYCNSNSIHCWKRKEKKHHINKTGHVVLLLTLRQCAALIIYKNLAISCGGVVLGHITRVSLKVPKVD